MQLAFMGSALLMGFLGSWHCGVMCGPLSCNFKTNQDFFTYHVGRLISYLVLGTLLSYGTQYFLNTDSRAVKMAASVVFGVVFIYFGLTQLNVFKQNVYLVKYYKFQFKLLEINKKTVKKFPVVLGLLTGLFPCSWLYSFLLLSTQMKTLQESLMLIVIFWLTALPAFMVFNGFMKNLIKSSPISYQTLSGVILIGAGLFSVFGHWVELIV